MSEETVEELQERVHQLEENLRKVKSLDELTGLYNRNTYYDRVRCRFENEPDREYVIVCFDVEKFKFVNDRFGFVEGDRLLSYIGKKLQERAAKYGLVAARLSGDVFSFMDFEENIQPDALGAEIQSLKKGKKSTFGKEIPIYGTVIHRYYFRFAESLQTTSL